MGFLQKEEAFNKARRTPPVMASLRRCYTLVARPSLTVFSTGEGLWSAYVIEVIVAK